MVSTGDAVNGIDFVETLRSLPRKPSFWLDDWLFWFPILQDACGQAEPPSGAGILVTDKNVYNPILYDEATKLAMVPIAVACELFNQYVTEMRFEPSAAIASDFTMADLYTLFDLYHGMGTNKEPWILKILFKSAIDFRFNSLVEFVRFGLDRSHQQSGAFLDDLLTFTTSNRDISRNKKRVLNAAITEEPLPSIVRGESRSPMEEDDMVVSSEIEDRPETKAIVGLPKVFISYVHENKRMVRNLVRDLEQGGVGVWWDEEGLETGSRWKDRIRNAIQRGDFFIACFSKEYQARRETFMNEELLVAVEQLRTQPRDRVWFIPVRLSSCEIPDIPIGAGESLRDLQWVDLEKDRRRGIARILTSILPNEKLVQ